MLAATAGCTRQSTCNFSGFCCKSSFTNWVAHAFWCSRWTTAPIHQLPYMCGVYKLFACAELWRKTIGRQVGWCWSTPCLNSMYYLGHVSSACQFSKCCHRVPLLWIVALDWVPQHSIFPHFVSLTFGWVKKSAIVGDSKDWTLNKSSIIT